MFWSDLKRLPQAKTHNPPSLTRLLIMDIVPKLTKSQPRLKTNRSLSPPKGPRRIPRKARIQTILITSNQKKMKLSWIKSKPLPGSLPSASDVFRWIWAKISPKTNLPGSKTPHRTYPSLVDQIILQGTILWWIFPLESVKERHKSKKSFP
jgi:hypothetical protein